MVEQEPKNLLQAILATHLRDSRLGAEHHRFNMEQQYHLLKLGPNDSLVFHHQRIRSTFSYIDRAYARAGRVQPESSRWGSIISMMNTRTSSSTEWSHGHGLWKEPTHQLRNSSRQRDSLEEEVTHWSESMSLPWNQAKDMEKADTSWKRLPTPKLYLTRSPKENRMESRRRSLQQRYLLGERNHLGRARASCNNCGEAYVCTEPVQYWKENAAAKSPYKGAGKGSPAKKQVE